MKRTHTVDSSRRRNVRPEPMLTPDGLPARTDWSLASGLRYLNHGARGAVPTLAQRAQDEFRRVSETNPCDWFRDVSMRVASARREIAQFLSTSPDATALVPNVSAGASVVFANIPAWRGMEVVTTDHAYGAVLMGAQRLARRWDGIVHAVHIPLDASDDDVFDRITATLSDNTAIIVIDQITSATAKELPVGRVAQEGRRRGIPVLIDAAHAPGLLAEPLSGIDADFWVGNLHKFACAPPGTAAIVASGPRTQLLFPLIDSWGAPEPFPARFDQQGTVDITSYLAAPVAFHTISQRYGWDEARQYIRELGDYAQAIVTDALSEATGEDLRVPTSASVNGLRIIRLPEGLATTRDAARVLSRLIATTFNIEVSVTTWEQQGFLRLSAHIYNTADDFEDFISRVVPFIAQQSLAARSE